MIGPVIKKIREQQGLTQKEVYDHFLSKRQAIRFENGTVDVRARILLSVISILDLDWETLIYLTDEGVANGDKLNSKQQFQSLQFGSLSNKAPFEFYKKYHTSLDPKLKQLAIMAAVNYWVDADVPEEEKKWLSDYYVNQSSLTINQLEFLIRSVLSVREDLIKDAFRRISSSLSEYGFHSKYSKLKKIFLDREFVYYLLNQKIELARNVLNEQMKNKESFDLDGRLRVAIQSEYLEIAISDGEQSKQKVRKLLKTYELLTPENAQYKIDAYLDELRRIRQIYGYHVEWTDAEIGTVIRLLSSVPRTVKKDMTTYIKEIPGLWETLKKKGHPFDYYRGIYPTPA